MEITMQPLGTWKNAPLAYVVAEVRFGNILSLDAVAARFQDLITATYPRLIKGQAVALSFGEQGVSTQVVPRYQFLSEDGRSCVVLTNDTISVHATSYIDSAYFANGLAVVWDAWLLARPKTFVERLGLRYWDIVLPEGGLPVGGFFAPPLSAVETLWAGKQLARHTHELVYSVDGPIQHTAIARLGTVPAVHPHPPNFVVVPELLPSKRLQRAVKFARESSDATVGFVDVDASADIARVLDVASFVDCAKGLHESQSSVFKSITSLDGQAIWKDGNPNA
ncbi:TIGR04255 family protein [Paraburkholderia lacunae]|uniref:TIGR04255 family protein n=1 Tax=Paraburkholderia lacunae TaxID=2211104 RepID=A0A370MXK4_9BURK|nr:TIGR04255 family protein [Paraburkholderia lacunae]RDJ98121.1 hypothetical protein DLM46_34850 [Paraburkholderia lacunae]